VIGCNVGMGDFINDKNKESKKSMIRKKPVNFNE